MAQAVSVYPSLPKAKTHPSAKKRALSRPSPRSGQDDGQIVGIHCTGTNS
ncbi:MAG TPA: hypothetical protein VJ526_15030 [Beijerinckiaceae bacterium]|nr:hypothetical protein [Beijerinckiaceae bacterium]